MHSIHRGTKHHVEMNDIAKSAINRTNTHQMGVAKIMEEEEDNPNSYRNRLSTAYNEAWQMLTEKNTLSRRIYGVDESIQEDTDDEEEKDKND